MKAGTAFCIGQVTAAERDGIAASKYASQHGLSVKVSRYWCRKLRACAMAVAPANQFITLSVEQNSNKSRQSGYILMVAGIRLKLPKLPPPRWLAAIALATQDCR